VVSLWKNVHAFLCGCFSEQTREWATLETDWRAAATESLRRDTGKNPATHDKRDEAASPNESQ
jgi:hypothetical protein